MHENYWACGNLEGRLRLWDCATKALLMDTVPNLAPRARQQAEAAYRTAMSRATRTSFGTRKNQCPLAVQAVRASGCDRTGVIVLPDERVHGETMTTGSQITLMKFQEALLLFACTTDGYVRFYDVHRGGTQVFEMLPRDQFLYTAARAYADVWLALGTLSGRMSVRTPARGNPE